MKTVFITGGSGGIGKTICNELKNKYKITVPGRKELDLTSEVSIKNYVEKNKNAPIDIIINNAGVGYPTFLENISDDIIKETINVNLIAPLKLIRGLVTHMKKNHYGKIINMSSILGIVSSERRTVYSATKSGLNGITRSLAIELGPYNILVNSICPGYVDTELTKKNISPKVKKQLIPNIPLRRFAQPEEIAKVIAFLISEENTYITGHLLVIDGGFTCL